MRLAPAQTHYKLNKVNRVEKAVMRKSRVQKIACITDSLKLLGVTINSKLNFSEHINMICKIARQKIGVLMRQMLNLCFSKQQYCRTLHIATLCGTFAEPVILVKSSGCKKGACVLFLGTMLATLNF